MFIKIKRKIRRSQSKKVITLDWAKKFFTLARIKKYFPGAKKLLGLEVELVRNFRAKFREMALKYSLEIAFDPSPRKLGEGRKEKRTVRAKINTLHDNPQRYYQVLKFLEEHGFKGQIVRPLEYYYPLNMLFYEGMAGETFQDYLAEHRKLNLFLKCIPQISKCLKKLHAVSSLRLRALQGSLPVRDLEIEKSDRRHWLFLMKKCAPDFYLETKQILDELWKLRKKSRIFLKTKHFSLIHGDFHWGNILKTDNKIALLDFGNSLLADPLEDAARLIVQTESMFRYYAPRKKELAKKIIDKFLKNYFVKPLNSEELLRLYYFQANSYVQMAAIQALVETYEPAKQRGIKALLKGARKKLKLLQKSI